MDIRLRGYLRSGGTKEKPGFVLKPGLSCLGVCEAPACAGVSGKTKSERVDGAEGGAVFINTLIA